MTAGLSVSLRPARPLDAGAVGAILHRFETETPWMPKQHSQAEAVAFCAVMIDRGWVTVAQPCEQGSTAGTEAVAGFLARDGHDIHALYVQPEQQGRGIGRHLLRAAMDETAELRLWTFQANDGAQRFYLREGFVEIRRTEGTENDEGLPDIQYLWPAEAS